MVLWAESDTEPDARDRHDDTTENMSHRRNRPGLRRSVVDWYANMLVGVVLIGVVTFFLIALRIGPTGLLLTFGLSLAILFTVLFFSLAMGSDLIYRSLNSR